MSGLKSGGMKKNPTENHKEICFENRAQRERRDRTDTVNETKGKKSRN